MGLFYKEIPFEIKEVTDAGVIEGYGSTFGGKPDSYGDVIVQGAYAETLKKGGRNGSIPMLWNHDSKEPIGRWTELVENAKGLKVRGELIMEVQRAREVHALAKANVLGGLSIGWDFPRDENRNIVKEAFEEDNKKRIRYLKQIELWEISPVTFPANTRATITGIKHIAETQNIRDLEHALRESGMTRTEALHVISLCKKSLREFKDNSGTVELLQALKSVNTELDMFKFINSDLYIENKTVIPFKSYPLASEGEAWNGPEEIRKATAEQLKIMSTWYDSANPDIKSSYKLPHHKADGKYTTVWRAVSAAMAALLGARGGVQLPVGDKQGVYNHLKKHYVEFEKEAPELKKYDENELKEIFKED